MKPSFFSTVYYLFIIVLVGTMVFACSDVIEEDFSNDIVQLRAPSDQLESVQQVQNFWWEPLEDVVIGYRIEIVSPSFDTATTLVETAEVLFDEGTTYQTTLSPGTYEWTVVGYNSTSETVPQIFKLTILSDSLLDLSGQTLLLQSPVSGLETRDTVLDFSWGLLSGADEYRFQIASPDFSSSNNIVKDEFVSGSNLKDVVLEEGVYTWRVRAENDQSVSAYTSRNLIVDLTAPSAPILTSPGNRDTVDLPVTLSWTVDPESVLDSVYIYRDSLVAPVIQIFETTATSLTFDDDRSSSYFWRVKSVDAAGNVSGFSPLRRFFVR